MHFLFKILILPLVLPSLGLCCPGRPHLSPLHGQGRERVKRKETRKSVRTKQTEKARKAARNNSENK